MLHSQFFIGKFEYPQGSGKWYKGDYEPLIPEKLFKDVQKVLDLAPKKEWGYKDFHFVRTMTCGGCGSGITAEEKFKHQQNGNTHRYVYYKCTRKRDETCKNAVINEDDLVEQLKTLIDDLDIQVVPMKEKIASEVRRFKLFQQMLVGTKAQIAVKDIDIRNYAKFILQEGTIEEKREFFSCLKTKITLSNKVVILV
jgi:hypothetical protein